MMNIQKEALEFVTARRVIEAAVRKYFAEHPNLYNEKTAEIVNYVLGLEPNAYVDDPNVDKALRILREIVADLVGVFNVQIRSTRWTLEHIRYMGLSVEVGTR
jgi:hypothetical protein